MIENSYEWARADIQLIIFSNKEDFFKLQQAKDTNTRRSPDFFFVVSFIYL